MLASPEKSAHARTSDVLIAGAGIIGLSLALELRWRGTDVSVLDRGRALGGASTAAAGMLAAEDPHNPPALLSLSRYSLALYAGFLARIELHAAQPVPFQTDATLQYTGKGAYRLAEHSIDPRQLGAALLAAARASGVRIVEHAVATGVTVSPSAVTVRTSAGECFLAGQLVHATGAWSPILAHGLAPPIVPRKGQMLRVAMPQHATLQEVHRAQDVYIVPRTAGPQAGTAIIGATVEDAGFDLSTDAAKLQQLCAAAAALAPETAFAAEAPLLEAWAGLRPCTPDLLPLLGRIGEREWIATGHFRNGILLAPGTAHILAELITGRPSPIDLTPFHPARFENPALGQHLRYSTKPPDSGIEHL